MISSNRSNESCNTFDDLPDKIYIPNIKEDVNAKVKHISYHYKCRFGSKKFN